MTDAAPDAPRASGARWRSLAGFALGVVLLGAAVWAVANHGPYVREAWGRVRGAPSLLLVAAVVLPVINLALASQTLAILSRRYGRIGSGEMGALVGTAWLLNYLPLRPGMIGRMAYHKAVNGIAVRDSVKVLVLSMVLEVIAMVLLIGAVLGAGALPGSASDSEYAAMFAAPLVLLIGLAIALRMRDGQVWRLGAATVLRYIDLLAWVARYWVVYRLVGSPVTAGHAAVFACVAQAGFLVPLVGNGLGLREWGSGVTAALLPAGAVAVAHGASARDVGLAAELVNRSAELLAAVPVGLVSFWFVSRWLRAPGDTGGA